MRRIVVGIPSGDMVHADFMMSLVGMLVGSVGKLKVEMGCVNFHSSIIQMSRCSIVKEAKDAKADGILWLDSDMTFPPRTMARLLSHGLPIVGCTYRRRMEPFATTTKDVAGKEFTGEGMTGLQEVGGLGFGCLYTDMTVLDKIGMPYFRVEYRDGKWQGEDFLFCEQARALGYKVMCDLDLSRELTHLGQKAVRL